MKHENLRRGPMKTEIAEGETQTTQQQTEEHKGNEGMRHRRKTQLEKPHATRPGRRKTEKTKTAHKTVKVKQEDTDFTLKQGDTTDRGHKGHMDHRKSAETKRLKILNNNENKDY